MAIFEASARRKPGTRSNTKLVVSGGMSPAGQWITDPNLPVLFHYEYGGPGQKEVVVSKGMLVGVAPERALDDHHGFKKNVLTIATDTIRPFGMAPYNFTKHYPDFLDGNQPSVITREYVELPLIGNPDDAAAVKWGAAYNEPGLEIKAGDLVTWSRNPENFGKIIKWDPSKHAVSDIIGQVGELEDDQEPFGWLKWAMWDEAARRQDQDGPINKSGYSAPSDGGYPFDPEYSRLGKSGENGYFSQYYTTENDATGIPGLLDGRNKALTVHNRQFIAGEPGVEKAYDLGLKNIIDGTFKAVVENTDITNDVRIDLTNGVFYYTADAATTGKTINVEFRCEFFGTPAGWDYKGATGAVRILLKF